MGLAVFSRVLYCVRLATLAPWPEETIPLAGEPRLSVSAVRPACPAPTRSPAQSPARRPFLPASRRPASARPSLPAAPSARPVAQAPPPARPSLPLVLLSPRRCLPRLPSCPLVRPGPPRKFEKKKKVLWADGRGRGSSGEGKGWSYGGQRPRGAAGWVRRGARPECPVQRPRAPP